MRQQRNRYTCIYYLVDLSTWTLQCSLCPGWMWMWTLGLPSSSSSCSASSCWWPYSAVLRWCSTLTVISLPPHTRRNSHRSDWPEYKHSNAMTQSKYIWKMICQKLKTHLRLLLWWVSPVEFCLFLQFYFCIAHT